MRRFGARVVVQVGDTKPFMLHECAPLIQQDSARAEDRKFARNLVSLNLHQCSSCYDLLFRMYNQRVAEEWEAKRYCPTPEMEFLCELFQVCLKYSKATLYIEALTGDD